MDARLNQRLETISAKVSANGPQRTTPRDLLAWFRAQRRRPNIVAQVRSGLARFGLTTDPDFELAGIDDHITFKAEKPLYAVRFEEIATILKQDEAPPVVTVRQLLRWFNRERRGTQVTELIEAALEDHGLQTVPDFREVHIDAELAFQPLATPESPAQQNDTVEPLQTDVPATVRAAADATFRIGTLIKPELHSISPGAPLNRAVTCMMMHDISHLPVLATEHRVEGVVTWKGIAHHIAVSGGTLTDDVQKAMQAANVVAASEPFFRVLPQIIERNYVLVRDAKNRIAAIITKADVSRKFYELTEPFLLLSEIENHIRSLIEKGAFSREELRKQGDGEIPREIHSLHDLTLGEYLRILQHPEHWERLELPPAINREEFSAQLDNVRRVRNEVMHFDPDSPTQADLKTLRDFAKLLQTLKDRHVF